MWRAPATEESDVAVQDHVEYEVKLGWLVDKLQRAFDQYKPPTLVSIVFATFFQNILPMFRGNLN